MHDENLAVLRRSEFDIVVEDFGIPVSQHDLLTLTGDNWVNDHIIGKNTHHFKIFFKFNLLSIMHVNYLIKFWDIPRSPDSQAHSIGVHFFFS
jgi:hypothetical protein